MILAGAAVVLFVTEWVRLEATALAIMVLLALVPVGKDGQPVLSVAEALAGISSDAVVTIAGMFVVAAAITRTGALLPVSRRVVAIGGRSEAKLVLALMLVSAVLSAFINNTAVVAVFIPLALSVARDTGVPPSKLLIPLSFGAILGGTCTLIGTSTNLVVAGIAAQHGIEPLRMFEFGRAGLLYAVVGIAVTVLVGRRFLPSHTTVASAMPPGGGALEYVTEIEIAPGSPLVGQTLGASLRAAHPGLNVMQRVHGEAVHWAPGDGTVLEPHDVLVALGTAEDLLAIRATPGVTLLPDPAGDGERIGKGTTLAELVVAPGSRALGVTVNDLELRRTYGVAVIAVQRRGVHLREGLSSLALEFGDVLLVQGTPEQFAELRTVPDFLVLDAIDARVVRHAHARRTLMIAAVMIGLVAWRPGQVSVIVLLASMVFVAAGCLTVRGAYRSIEMPILLLIAGALALGRAVDHTGAGEVVAETFLRPFMSIEDPALRARIVLSALYLLTSLVTEFMSNNAAAALLAPVAISTAAALGVDPRALLFAVAFGGSASFATPIGYQTNTLVYSAGGYRFGDFLRAGIWMNLTLWLLASLLFPVLWPMTPV